MSQRTMHPANHFRETPPAGFRPSLHQIRGGPAHLRDQVIAPILAGVRSPRTGRQPAHWIKIDRDYETLRTHMQTLRHDLGIAAKAAPAG
jgi:hypothetical protein